MLACDTDIK
jgi:hypothetical protein